MSGGAEQSRRDRVVSILCDQFAEDRIGVEEFETLIDRAHAAQSVTELETLVAGLDMSPSVGSSLLQEPVTQPIQPSAAELPQAPSRKVESPAPHPPAPATSPREQDSVIAVFGGASRRGHWQVARRTRVVAVFGGADIDLREVEFADGVTEVHVVAAWGGVEILVPPDLPVEVAGVAVFGGFEGHGTSQAQVRGASILRVSGLAFMGGVEVKARYPGESARDAKRRRRLERKNRRRALKRVRRG